MNDDQYYNESKKIRRKYQVLMLKELIKLNCKYYGPKEVINIRKVYNEMQNTVNFSDSEKEEIIEKCIKTLNKDGKLIIKK